MMYDGLFSKRLWTRGIADTDTEVHCQIYEQLQNTMASKLLLQFRNHCFWRSFIKLRNLPVFWKVIYKQQVVVASYDE